MSAPSKRDDPTSELDTVADLPINLFIKRWRQITGEPPAILLNSRSAMIALLVESVPVAPIEVHGGAVGEPRDEQAPNSLPCRGREPDSDRAA